MSWNEAIDQYRHERQLAEEANMIRRQHEFEAEQDISCALKYIIKNELKGKYEKPSE